MKFGRLYGKDTSVDLGKKRAADARRALGPVVFRQQ